MHTKYTRLKIDKKYIAVFAAAVFFSWTLHELAHWTAGTWLGYRMGMSLNATYPLSGSYQRDSHYQLVSAAGPVFTLLEAILVFVLMMRKKRLGLYPFLFTCFYMRFFATVISFRNPNDEARIGSALGIGKFTLPVAVTALLLLLVYKTSKKYRLGFKFNLANLGLVILFSSAIILADMYFKWRLL